MSGWFERKDSECSLLRESLEEIVDRNSLPPALAAHAASCRDCQTALDELFASRALLSALARQPDEARPWLAVRVMAAIGEQESKLTKSLETWVVVPRLASKLAWCAALALVLTTSWLAGRPQAPPATAGRTDIAGEPMIESHAVPVTNDEVLASLTEKME
jgi:hypothetical protein